MPPAAATVKMLFRVMRVTCRIAVFPLPCMLGSCEMPTGPGVHGAHSGAGLGSNPQGVMLNVRR
ncbi:hypothetical protein GCM10019017_64020 [Streptomyces showdoensis]